MKKQKAKISIGKNEPFKVEFGDTVINGATPYPPQPEYVVNAIKAIAEATQANAAVLKSLADNMAGPPDYRCGMKFENCGNSK